MGNKRGHKGGHRRFTNPQEIEFRKQKEEREREWRRQRGEISDEEDEENSQEDESSSEEEDLRKKSEEARKRNQQKKTEVEEEDEESSEEEALIEICNPNRMPQKAKKNVTLDDKVVLSRKEREEIEKQKAKDHYQKLTAEGKTKEAQDDLARLALVRQRREEAAKKKKELAKKEENANAASTSKTKK